MPVPNSTPTRRTARRPVTSIPQPPDPQVELRSDFYAPSSTAPRSRTVVDHSGANILLPDALTLNGVSFHRADAAISHCDRCEAPALSGELVRVRGSRPVQGVPWCPSCADAHTWRCHACSVQVSDSLDRYFRPGDSGHDEPICPRCRPPAPSGIYGSLLNYSNKAISTEPPADDSSMLYGFEVETHVRNNRSVHDAITELHRLMGNGYYVTKSDGSLDNGFEIVTRPDSMKIHREKWLKVFESIDSSEFLKEHLRSWSAPRQCCGIHCHVDKSRLSQLQLGKLNVWLNHKNNRAFIEKVAGRGSNSYTSFKDDVKIIDGRRLKAGTSPERYVALNVGTNTAEMRLFRGTLHPPTFFKILDFIEASVEWTGLGNCSARAVTDVSQFATFVHKNHHRFPFLLGKMQEWGIEPTKA